jgi:hypothetical protein
MMVRVCGCEGWWWVQTMGEWCLAAWFVYLLILLLLVWENISDITIGPIKCAFLVSISQKV